MPRALNGLLSIICLATGLGGCATVTTQPLATADRYDPGASFNVDKAAPGKGIAYFLPRQLAQVIVKRVKQADVKVPKDMADAIKAQAQAQEAVDAARAAAEDAAASVAAAENAIVAAGSSPSGGLAILDQRLEDEENALVAAEADLVKAQDEFATATDAIKALDLSAKPAPPVARGAVKAGATAAASKQDYIATVEITLLPPSADPRHGFRIDPRHSWFRDDTHKLTISDAGLLTSSDVVAVDRTGDVIVALAQAAGAVSGLSVGPAPPLIGPAAPPPPPTVCQFVPSKVTLIVDFASNAEVNNLANSKLNCMGVRLAIIAPASVESPFKEQSTKPFDGIAYRTPVEQWVAIQACAKAEVKDCNPADSSQVDTANPMWRTSQVIALRLPQAGPISYLPQNAGFLTRTSYTAAFQDGMLTTYNDERPSEALQVAGIPMRVIHGVFDGVSQVISLRTGSAKARTDLSQAQKSEIAAQYDVLAARIQGNTTISDAQKSNLESQVALAKAGLEAQGSLADAQAALLQQQTNLIIAQTNGPTQVLENRVSDVVKARKAQAKLEKIRACVAAQRTAGEPIDSCLE